MLYSFIILQRPNNEVSFKDESREEWKKNYRIREMYYLELIMFRCFFSSAMGTAVAHIG